MYKNIKTNTFFLNLNQKNLILTSEFEIKIKNLISILSLELYPVHSFLTFYIIL